MAKERLSMRKTKEILRLRWSQGLSVRETSRSVGVSTGVIDKTVCRARAAGLTWAQIEVLPETELEAKLYGVGPVAAGTARAQPDPVYMHQELKRVGVTLELLHLEYLQEHPEGYRYTSFCEVYRRWRARKPMWMRQSHKAGEKAFTDYSGKRPWFVDPTTGEVVEVELFVSALGASSYTYVEATRTQRIEDWLSSHNRMVEFYGGVTTMVVPDQLKSAVTTPCRYEPGITRSYAQWAQHYGTAIVPARPRKPRDKAKVEVAVQVAQRWVLARLRNEVFFSLEALNARIAELLEELNARPMRAYGGASRRDLFERLDKPALRPLPETRFEIAAWGDATVNRDYHFEVCKHLYSAPHALLGERIETRSTGTTVEGFLRGQRVCCHVRDDTPFRHTTDLAHMPQQHRHHADGIDSVLAWAETVGPFAIAMVNAIVSANVIREQGFRSARGLQRIGERFGAERTEAACKRAVGFGARSYKPVERILRLGRELTTDPRTMNDDSPGICHENVRGPGYYH
jgi:transposase